MNSNLPKDSFDLADLLQNIRRHIVLLISVTLLFGVCGYVGTKTLIVPQYEAAVTMIVNTRQDSSKTVTNDNITSAQNLVSTYSVIIKSNTVLDQVNDTLGLNLSYREMNKTVTVSAVNDTQIMRIAARNPDRSVAIKIVEQIAEIAPDVIVDTVEAGSCKVISKVMADETPVYPNTLKNTLLFMVIGAVQGLAFEIIRLSTRSKNIVDDEDAQKYLGLPVLGVIPELEKGKQ